METQKQAKAMEKVGLYSPRTINQGIEGPPQGAASISRNKTYAKPKTYAKLWKVLYITEGSIVTIAILVKAGTLYHKALLKFYNDIIFKAQTDNNTVALINDDNSSGLEEAFTRLTLTPTTSTPGQASHSGAHVLKKTPRDLIYLRIRLVCTSSINSVKLPPLTLTPTYVPYSRPSYKYEDFIFPPPQSSPHPCLTEILVMGPVAF
ncbi:uncharacterized protein LACBIDRAFT_328156 [Laccaria bicolor S238N-H82]|uniref:Predicted protein n=1 Tax=Laccaria bicolor (strain S238N-H82 / ATCC MYA-4686) TaxID=486041 RepID=B0DDX5_LACBS|nr:uncharacterized protein LACBIDRAFT_328156 [Laccaria bicolor S238N-H82]EDR07294.1 predicted protein [Laccaria bicolor S238N-H82]|eukprot:XP_001882225.1 predicted protein [Laccaria bicolor S238N-H82]